MQVLHGRATVRSTRSVRAVDANPQRHVPRRLAAASPTCKASLDLCEVGPISRHGAPQQVGADFGAAAAGATRGTAVLRHGRRAGE
jgi:hypothetical protein